MRVREPDIRFEAEIRAPIGVVFQQGATEATEDGGVEGVDVVRRRREAHLSIGEVEHEVFPLVLHVGGLEPEEQGEPVEEVVVGLPCGERRPAEVADGAEGRGGSADLGEAEGGVVGEEVVDWDDVVNVVVLGALIHCCIRGDLRIYEDVCGGFCQGTKGFMCGGGGGGV